ncbi:esterase-like activity of phytase family protein [Pseudalkalibacillus decolorationis]|uniref:esterase-like activity of phytase family protein n=1 Tax=Pseudalkalibacillus decolorationis TaxID=163879 RepID=UPI0021494DDA|nr:esterase-like activity of phytase family protein [Pseudalkalibacillus decolorationis]
MSRVVKVLATSMVAIFLLVYSFGAASADDNKSHYSKKATKNISEKLHQKPSKRGKDRESVHSVDKLRLLGSKIVSNDTKYKETVVGGLSGLTYDSKKKKWYIVSDDRSEINSARFYTGKLKYSLKGFKSVHFTGVTFLRQPNGSLYPSSKTYSSDKEGYVPDFESIRIDPRNGGIWYTSEGDRALGQNPVIRHATVKGKYLSGLPLPENAKMDDQSTKGFRNNLALEGSTFSIDGLSFWTAMEGPLLQDDNIPTVDSGSVSRLTQYNRDGNVIAQYAYNIDAIPAKPGPGKFADNGVTDILAINEHEFLILERSAVQAADGSFKNHIRIYKINTKNATDISRFESIKDKDFVSVDKELVLNLNELGLSKLDNIEGMAWGKKLKNGHDSLVVVSDNNFNNSQVTQFIALEVLPEK